MHKVPLLRHLGEVIGKQAPKFIYKLLSINNKNFKKKKKKKKKKRKREENIGTQENYQKLNESKNSK